MHCVRAANFMKVLRHSIFCCYSVLLRPGYVVLTRSQLLSRLTEDLPPQTGVLLILSRSLSLTLALFGYRQP